MNNHINKKRKVDDYKAKYLIVKRKSQAGIEYEFYKQVYPQNPTGLNHLAKKHQDAIERKYNEKLANIKRNEVEGEMKHRQKLLKDFKERKVKKLKKPSTWVSKRSIKKNGKRKVQNM